MTTFIVANQEGACDSKWSNKAGEEVTVSLNKYLYLPDDFLISDQQLSKVVYYSGDAEPIILHQAYLIEAITADQYRVWNENLLKAFPDTRMSFAVIGISGWCLESCELVDQDQGLITGGSGGRYAREKYFDSYCLLAALQHAIENDELSGEPIVYYNAHDIESSSIVGLEQSGLDSIADNALTLIRDLQAKQGAQMGNFKYSGCSTSAEAEAPVIDLDELSRWVRAQEFIRAVAKNAAAEGFSDVKLIKVEGEQSLPVGLFVKRSQPAVVNVAAAIAAANAAVIAHKRPNAARKRLRKRTLNIQEA
jgi:hypothetical protein